MPQPPKKSGMMNFISTKGTVISNETAKKNAVTSEKNRRNIAYGKYSDKDLKTKSDSLYNDVKTTMDHVLPGDLTSSSMDELGKNISTADSLSTESRRRTRKYAFGTDSIVVNKPPTRRTEKEKLKARQASFSPVQNARVNQSISQSQNGFKGQTLNDHGLPAGRTPIIQNVSEDGQNAKFRKQKYALGTQSMTVDNPIFGKRKNRRSTDEADKAGETATATKRDMVPVLPNLAPVSRSVEDDLDAVIKETKSPAMNVPAQTKSIAQIQDMDKVRQHQEKLNKYGANLKVDGMWGAKTEAASRDLYPKYKENLSQIPGNSRFKQSPKITTNEIGEKMMGKREDNKEATKLTPVQANGAPIPQPSTKKEPYVAGNIGKFMSKDSSIDQVRSMQDTSQRRNARVTEKMYGDPDMHVGSMNRSQAEKVVDIEDREDAAPSQLGKIGGGLAIGAAALGTAGLIGLAVRGKMKGNRAILAAAKAGRKLPEEVGLLKGLGNELSQTSVFKKGKSFTDKVTAPFKEANSVKKVLAKAEEKAATSATNKATKEAAKITQAAEKESSVFKKANSSTSKNNESMLNRTQGEQDAVTQRALRANGVADKEKRINVGKSVKENREDTRSVFRTDRRSKSNKLVGAAGKNSEKLSKLGYKWSNTLNRAVKINN